MTFNGDYDVRNNINMLPFLFVEYLEFNDHWATLAISMWEVGCGVLTLFIFHLLNATRGYELFHESLDKLQEWIMFSAWILGLGLF